MKNQLLGRATASHVGSSTGNCTLVASILLARRTDDNHRGRPGRKNLATTPGLLATSVGNHRQDSCPVDRKKKKKNQKEAD